MILVDHQNFFMASFSNAGGFTDGLDAGLTKHTYLNWIRSVRRSYHERYGDLVICADGRNVWRRDVFPHYKANRRKGRAEQPDKDWDSLFRLSDEILDDLRVHFPYPVVRVNRAEGDDVIAVLSRIDGIDLRSPRDLVCSMDKDLVQLISDSTDWYNPVTKTVSTVDDIDPVAVLEDKVIRGDTKDGVPNSLSEDDVFVTGTRQTMMTARRYDDIRHARVDADTVRRLERNRTLVDLSRIPEDVQDDIGREFFDACDRMIDRSKILDYLMRERLSNLVEYLNDF